MRVLVTGASGYLGQVVVAALQNAGHQPVSGSRSGHRVSANVDARHVDLQDRESLTAALAEVDAVCHLAALTRVRESWDAPSKYFEINTAGTIALLAAMAEAEVRRIVFASTGAIYGSPDEQPMSEQLPANPPHPYAASKYAAELAIEWQARTGSMSAAVLRLFGIAGGDDPDPTRIVPRAVAVAAGEVGELRVNGDGTAVRDLLHVEDAAEAVVSALEAGPSVGKSQVYNIGSGIGSSVLDVVAAVERVSGRAVPVVHDPPAREPAALVADPSRAMTELGWKPRRSSLEAIVRSAWSARQARQGE